MKRIITKSNVCVLEDINEKYIYNFSTVELLSDGSFYICGREITNLEDPLGRSVAVKYFLNEKRVEKVTSPITKDAQKYPDKGFLMCYVTEISENNLIAVYGMLDTDLTKPLFAVKGDGMQNMACRISRSADNGVTWSGGEDIAFTHDDLIIPGKIIKLKDGTIGFPVEMHNHYGKDYNEPIQGRFCYSTNGGKTFDKVSKIPHDKGILAGDGRATQDKDGNLIVYYWFFDMNTGKDLNNPRTITRDNGRSFEPAEPVDLHMQITSPIYVDEQTFVAVYQERFSESPGLKAAISTDGGYSFDLKNSAVIYGADSVPDTANPFLSFNSFKFGCSYVSMYEKNKGLVVYWNELEHGISISACDFEIV